MSSISHNAVVDIPIAVNTTETIYPVAITSRGILNRIILIEKTAIGGAFSFDLFDRDVTGLTEAQRSPYRVMPRQTAASNAGFNNATIAGGHALNYGYATQDDDRAKRNLYIVINTTTNASARTYTLATTVINPVI